MTHLRPVVIDPALRLAAVLIFLFGAVVCSSGPYISVLAVEVFALGDRGYAALMVVSTLLSVSAALWVGIRADQTGNRRGLSLLALTLLCLGLGAMTLHPGPGAFVLAHALLLPCAGSFFGQIFAQARLAASPYPPAERDGIMAVIRALFAAPFVIVLPLWSVAFRAGVDLLAIYPVALALAALMLLLTFVYWPKDGSAAWQDRPSGLSFRAALQEVAQPPLMLRILALGAIGSAAASFYALVSLVLVPAIGRGPQDVAIYAGVVAGLEVPFMLLIPWLTRGRDRTVMILIGTAIYCIHLALLPILAPYPALWLLLLPAGLGGAVTLTLPIAYLQDMLSTRPGTGSSLMALQKLVGDVLAAASFAIGTALSGYGLVAALSCMVALTGGLALLLVDRKTRLS